MKKSASLTVAGLIILIAGSGMYSMGQQAYIASQFSRFGSGEDEAMATTTIGIFIAAAGLVMLCIGVYRALAKIDALPLPLDTVKDHESESSQGDHDAGELGEAPTSPAPFRV